MEPDIEAMFFNVLNTFTGMQLSFNKDPYNLKLKIASQSVMFFANQQLNIRQLLIIHSLRLLTYSTKLL